MGVEVSWDSEIRLLPVELGVGCRDIDGPGENVEHVELPSTADGNINSYNRFEKKCGHT